MSVAIIMLLLTGFALCVVVGLLTVLQNLASVESGEDTHQGQMFQDPGTK